MRCIVFPFVIPMAMVIEGNLIINMFTLGQARRHVHPAERMPYLYVLCGPGLRRRALQQQGRVPSSQIGKCLTAPCKALLWHLGVAHLNIQFFQHLK